MAAMQMKNTNSAIIARKALMFSISPTSQKATETYKTTTLFFTAKNASLNHGRPLARFQNPLRYVISPGEQDAGTARQNVKTQSR